MFWLCYNLWVDWYGRLGWKEHFASPHSCLFGGYVYCYNCCHSNHNLGRVNNTLQNSYFHSVVPGWLPRFWGELTCVARNWYYRPSGNEYCYELHPNLRLELSEDQEEVLSPLWSHGDSSQRSTDLPVDLHLSTWQCKTEVVSVVLLTRLSSVCRCTCEPGYTGKNCESEYIPCDPSPCLNDGACKQIDNLNYECQCVTGKHLPHNHVLLLRLSCRTHFTLKPRLSAFVRPGLIRINRTFNYSACLPPV